MMEIKFESHDLKQNKNQFGNNRVRYENKIRIMGKFYGKYWKEYLVKF